MAAVYGRNGYLVGIVGKITPGTAPLVICIFFCVLLLFCLALNLCNLGIKNLKVHSTKALVPHSKNNSAWKLKRGERHGLFPPI